MTINKFKEIKIKKDRKYLVTYKLPVINTVAYIYEVGVNIVKTAKHIKLKKWMAKRVYYRWITEIKEIL